MRVDLFTREYPPHVYGGAGVHVTYLARELAKLVDLTVHAFDGARVELKGDDRGVPVAVRGYDVPIALREANATLGALAVDLDMVHAAAGAQVVHSHTWYANMAGHLASLLYGIPHVVTAHSLEPLRPWKAEQLGGGYAVSQFYEEAALTSAAAIIAVSEAMRADVLRAYPAVDAHRVRVVHNGIDTEEFRPAFDPDALRRHGVDPNRPTVAFVGRVTQQKGLVHLLRAAPALSGVQLVICAGAADTSELQTEVTSLVDAARAAGSRIVWIEGMLQRSDLLAILSAARVFVCPSVYEPMGIVNLEAMACETAVVATATGGIPEVVADGETGLLVPPGDTDASGTPRDPEGFAAHLAQRINDLVKDPDRAERMGQAGRQRAIEHFSWSAIAAETAAVYADVTSGS